MNFKDFGIREWLVIAFIVIGLAAFAFEDIFKPKIYYAEGTGIGYDSFKYRDTQRDMQNFMNSKTKPVYKLGLELKF